MTMIIILWLTAAGCQQVKTLAPQFKGWQLGVMMIFAMMLGVATPATAADAISAAVKGLVAEIEDDKRHRSDQRLKSIKSRGCISIIRGIKNSWTIDWSKAEMVSLEDTFVFIAAPPEQIAIVGDASKADQAAKLLALHRAIQDRVARCKT